LIFGSREHLTDLVWRSLMRVFCVLLTATAFERRQIEPGRAKPVVLGSQNTGVPASFDP
jgi:hypothetical protein